MSSRTAPDPHQPPQVDHDDDDSRAAARGIGSRPRRPWSLAVRLAVGYGSAAFALLLLTSAYAYWSLAGSLAREDANFLAEEVEEVVMLLGSKPDGLGALRAHLGRESAAHLSSPLYLRALDGGGRVVAETEGMSSVAPPARFPMPSTDSRGRADARLTLDDGRPAHVMAAAVTIDGAPMVVHVALDRTFEHRLLGRYRQRMAVVLLLGLAACALTGFVIARRGLRPLGRMATVMGRIGSSTLDQRVDGTAFPADLSSLAATFNAMLQRLEDGFARLSRFSADIAHELRTPIHNVRGMVELALGRGRTGGDAGSLLVPCLQECERVSRLIDRLLFLARAENPATQIDRQVVDVARELVKVQEFYEAAAAERGVALEFEGPGAAGDGNAEGGDSRTLAEVDRQLFQQAVGNLVENALAHTPGGGRVRLSVAREGGAAVRVTVEDNGSGIAPEELPFVFDRFRRADPSRSKHTGGFGLGLALVKSIATLHAGTASADSRPGHGSRFTITFPAGQVPPATTATAAATTAAVPAGT